MFCVYALWFAFCVRGCAFPGFVDALCFVFTLCARGCALYFVLVIVFCELCFVFTLCARGCALRFVLSLYTSGNRATSRNTLHKPKVRFTMKGFTQQKGKHYAKTHASVAAIMTIYLTCIVAVEADMTLHNTDLRAAYLTAPIEPGIEMFIEPPPIVQLPEGWGLRVCKAIYGSRQGAQRLDVHKEKQLTAQGFIRSCAEPSLYFLPRDSVFGLVLITTVVDDFLICCRDEHMEAVKNKLHAIWTITDNGPAGGVVYRSMTHDGLSQLLQANTA